MIHRQITRNFSGSCNFPCLGTVCFCHLTVIFPQIAWRFHLGFNPDFLLLLLLLFWSSTIAKPFVHMGCLTSSLAEQGRIVRVSQGAETGPADLFGLWGAQY